ncbi:carbohydrate ABC transporter permease [Subtercola lobariae]|uniref:ABC transporter permease n=1 Tax=Subtercola lobariae TaxID=1588641 RepID=A0A917B6C0_9MICO|nr:carbohydrate ABC transporter permease [Subtercola lobariae]GGF20912.1 ABC transporter permease [Subtercola lobariae]
MRETTGFKTFRIITLAVLAVFVLLPLYVMITSALKPLVDVQGKFTWWPTNFTIQPFIDIWSTIPLASYFINSVIVATSASVISVIIAIFASYAISRYKFRGRNTFTTTILATQMFPGVLFLLPLYLIFINISQTLGIQLIGSYLGLIITYLTFTLPFAIWMLTGYFDNIPRELDEAATVDGSTAIGTLLRVILPVARPGIVAVLVYSFITAWGEVLFASVLTTQTSRTLAVGLGEYSTQVNVYWNQIMAASVVVSIPVVIGFLLLQRNFVAGLSAGAVK